MPIRDLSAFKAYDIRGQYGKTIDEGFAFDVAHALVAETGAKAIAVGADNRPSSPALKQAIIEGIIAQGADAIDIGNTGTEQVYFAAQHLDVDAGVQVTASHNPIGDNGLKFILRGGRPVESAMLNGIKSRMERGENVAPANKGARKEADILDAYVDHLLGYIDPSVLAQFKIVTNPGNGMAGHVIDAIEKKLGDAHFIKMHHQPHSTFPNGIPNPLLPENRKPTSDRLRETGADFAVAWDGDFDRCFFFDEKGDFIEGYYIVGLLGEAFLKKSPGAAIIHDPRLTWNTIETVKKAGGTPVQAKTGHAFIKAKMREVDGAYGGEMSAHHYFRDFGYCDSGMIPWLLIAELMAQKKQPLSALIGDAQAAFPCSGERNFRVEDTKASIAKVRAHFEGQNPIIDEMDGVSMAFATWRFNLRGSNTEPLLRLNIETRGDAKLVEKKLEEIQSLIV